MSKTLLIFSVVLFVHGYCAHAVGQPVRWDVGDGGNGHWYEVLTGPLLSNGVPSVVTWSDANLSAESRGGYLATISSPAENDFVFNLADSPEFWAGDTIGNYFGPWLGGEQLPGAPNPASDWAWVTGEPFKFTNWHSGEPNDLFGQLEEDRILFFATEDLTGTRSNYWNDEWSMRRITTSYVVEYIPEPAAFALALVTLFLAICRRSVP